MSVSDHERDEPMTSKFRNHNPVWCKANPNTKWKPGKIIDVLPNQSYFIELEDYRQFRRNEHHITGWHLHSCVMKYLSHTTLYCDPVVLSYIHVKHRLNTAFSAA